MSPAILTRINSFRLGEAAQLEKVAWLAALLAWGAYIAYFAHLASLPLQDVPNHLTRANILADLLFHGGSRFGSLFSFHLALSPYVLHDALLTVLVALFGTVTGAALFLTLVLLSVPCALLFYMRANGLAPRAASFIVLISMYLATDWFFLMGFMAFRLALACVIVSVALTDLLREQWRRSVFGWYIATLALGYLTHLTATVFFAPVLAVSGMLRLRLGTTTVRREISLWIPLTALLLLHFGLVAAPHDATHPSPYTYYWGTVHDKLSRLNWEFERFDGRPSPIMTYTLIAGTLWAVWSSMRWRTLLEPRVLENLMVAAVFLGLYWILPSAYEISTYVDVRALCMVTFFLVFAALNVPPVENRGRVFATGPVLGIAFLLACANFAYLVMHVNRNEAWLVRYRQVIAAIPVGAHVLPVYTQGAQVNISPFLHAASYVTLDRAALIPYLFSGDRGNLMTYFTYKRRPYMPEESWYKSLEYWHAGTAATYVVGGHPYTWRFGYDRVEHSWKPLQLAPVDWNRVACEYNFLLVTVPFQESYIEVPFRAVAYNETAALLAVDRKSCRPGAGVRQKVRLPSER